MEVLGNLLPVYLLESRLAIPANVRVISDKDQVVVINPDLSDWIKLTPEAWRLVTEACEGKWPSHLAPDDSIRVLFEYLFEHQYLINMPGNMVLPQPARNGNTSFSPGPVSPSSPEKLYLNVTDRCNLNCPTCYFGSGSGHGEYPLDLDTDQWHGIIDGIASDGVQCVFISGGEPLLRPDLINLLDHACRKFSNVVLLTNGTLITEPLASKMAQMDLRIQISVDGSQAVLHDSIRGDGTFSAAISGIKLLLSAGVKRIEIVPTITKLNIGDLAGLENLAQSLGVGYHFSLFMPVGRGKCRSRDLELTPVDLLIWAGDILDKMSSDPACGDGAESKCPDGQKIECHGPEAPLALIPRVSCGAGKSILSVGPDGKIYPCPLLHLPELACGNALTDSVMSALRLISGQIPDVDDLPGCSECDVRYFCGGGCRAGSFHERRDFLAKDPYCSFYRSLYGSFLWDWREDEPPEKNLKQMRENFKRAISSLKGVES